MKWIDNEPKHRIPMLAGVCLAVMFFALFWTQPVYYMHGSSPRRLRIACAILWLLITVFVLLFKNSLSDRVNRILSWLFLLAAPFISYVILELTQLDVISVDFQTDRMFLLYNLGIYALIVAVLFLVTCSIRFAVIASHTLCFLCGMAMYFTMQFRGTALILADLYSVGTAMNVAGGYEYSLTFNPYVAAMLLIFCIIFACKLRTPKRFSVKVRIPLALLAVCLCAGAYSFYMKSDTTKYRVRLWRPQDSYEKYGSMFAFVESGRYLMVEEPEGYDAGLAEEYAAPYRDVGDAVSDNTADKQPNIIVIMDEALCDIQTLNPKENDAPLFETNQDILPFIHGLSENTTKGNLFVSNLGGGTAIMEFEMLTGNTNAFLPERTIAYQTIIKERQPSYVSHLAGLGYAGLYAIHPYVANSYYRNRAYPLLGFSEFLDITSFSESDEALKVGETITDNSLIGVGNNISDRAAFQKIIEKYEETRKTSDAPFFSFEVTMQNHTPYSKVAEPEIKIYTEGFKSKAIFRYVNYIHETDKAFEQLVSYFSRVEEPTLICLFGDHPPSVKSKFYAKVMGKPESQFTPYETMRIRRTPFVIWTNYASESRYYAERSPNYLSGIISDIAGLQKTGYQRFLDALSEQIPVINGVGYIGADGNYYEPDDKTSPYYEWIHKYRVLQYNNLIDTDNRIEGFFE